ncbi:hypothetical protein Trydic_g16597 [Trypoxylus dichotomus]
MYLPIVFFVILTTVDAEETCVPPQELTNSENNCLESTTTFLQRVQHQATGLFVSAKRKLGIDPNAAEDPLKCDYYLCILRNLGMVNDFGILQLQEIKSWLTRYVPDEFQNEFILHHAATCFEEVEKNESNKTNCDRSLEYVKCLHDFQKCQIFKYP